MTHLILSLLLSLDVFFLSPFTEINAVLVKLLIIAVIFLPKEMKIKLFKRAFFFFILKYFLSFFLSLSQ